MRRDISRISHLFLCPDCKADITMRSSSAQCSSCGKTFEMFNDVLIDLMPSKKFTRTGKSFVEKRSIEAYNKLCDEPVRWKDDPSPWGLECPENYRRKLAKHNYIVNKLVPESIGCFCDISAGSGRFSWEIAKRSTLAIMCDLSVDSVVYLSKRAREEKEDHIFIVRCDYLQPPFKEDIFDFVLCNDTLIYGPPHEKRLLSSIYGSLKPAGNAVLDISYKYHRGFWHRPYTFGYSYNKMRQMLQGAGFHIEKSVPLYYELSNDLDEVKLSSKVLKYILPPTRYIFKTIK